MPSIYQQAGIYSMLLVILLNLFFLVFNIFCQQLNLLNLSSIWSIELYTGHVNIYCPLDTSFLFHACPPVLEGIRNKSVCRYGGYGLVSVLNLDCIQSYFNNITIRSIFRHLYPIANSEHVICSELNTCNKTHDGVLENKSGNRCQSTDTAK